MCLQPFLSGLCNFSVLTVQPFYDICSIHNPVDIFEKILQISVIHMTLENVAFRAYKELGLDLSRLTGMKQP